MNIQEQLKGIHCELNATNKKGKIKVEVLHKPQIGNIWINLWDDDFMNEHNEKHNLCSPQLISFSNYETYCKYVGSEEFNTLFEIVEFRY